MKRLDISHFTWDHIWGKPIIYHISTAVLRKVLLKCGRFLTQIDLSEVPNYLGIGTLTMIAKFCPNLTNIDVSALPICTTGLYTLTKKCKKITKLSLGASTHVLDNDLKNVFKEYQDLNHFAIRSNGDISGKCLSYLPALTMRTLIVEQCHNIADVEFSRVSQTSFVILHQIVDMHVILITYVIFWCRHWQDLQIWNILKYVLALVLVKKQ